MKSYKIKENKGFIGRKWEMGRLAAIRNSGQAEIIVVYGRRRIGKTELIEQAFRKEFVWKFEGIQREQRKGGSAAAARQYQISRCLRRFAKYMATPALARVRCDSWTEFFELLDPIIKRQPSMVLYFEEIQWLSSYSPEFLAELKPFWDDSWRHCKGLKMVLCGSAPSFITRQVMADKALYARSVHEIHLKEFSPIEMQAYMNAGPREVMLAQLTVGGIPEYLRRLRGAPSVFLGLCENSFTPDAFFSLERERIFVSSLRENSHYKGIIDYLGRTRYAAREQIRKGVGMGSGGSLTALLADLERCGFVEKYTPLHLGPDSLAVRYCISDEYLQFHQRFIHPMNERIQRGEFTGDPTRALNMGGLRQVLGFSFERWCRRNSHIFARILGFDRIEYQCGAFFNRKTAEIDEGFQIDLAYIRRDAKVLICEIKYTETPIGGEVAEDVSRKEKLFRKAYPKCRNYTYETVLITTDGRRETTRLSEFFDHVITFDDIFDPRHWDVS